MIHGPQRVLLFKRYKNAIYQRCRLRRMQRFAHIRDALRMMGCDSCGFDAAPWILQFHHRDPTCKRACLGGTSIGSWTKFWAELEKCDILCPNCHALVSFKVNVHGKRKPGQLERISGEIELLKTDLDLDN